MHEYIGLFFLVIAVSLDGFGVGITYGLRKVRVPLQALLVITLCSGAVVLLSMMLGGVLREVLPPRVASSLGSILLILIGLYTFGNALRHKFKSPCVDEEKVHHWKDVLSNPEVADLDHSGVISIGEAVVLGIALALDAFASGFAASIIGYPLVLTPFLIALMSGTFLYMGLSLGSHLAKRKRMRELSFLPPLLLVLIGVLSFFR